MNDRDCVKISFNISLEAADRLRQLVARGDVNFREMGIMSLQLQGDQLLANANQPVSAEPSKDGTNHSVACGDHNYTSVKSTCMIQNDPELNEPYLDLLNLDEEMVANEVAASPAHVDESIFNSSPSGSCTDTNTILTSTSPSSSASPISSSIISTSTAVTATTSTEMIRTVQTL